MGNRISLKDIIDEMTVNADLPREFGETFFDEIKKDDALLKEFLTYVFEHRFTLENKIKGVSVLDIMVWQMDHFKSHLDRGEFGMKNNECEMILKAFDTYMKMKVDPEKYYRLMTEETGTDYEGHYE